MHVTAAYFNLEKTDAKTTDLAGAVTLLGDQEINGVEFTVAGAIMPKWNVYGGMSFMDGKVKKSATLSEEGVILPYVPKAMLNLWSTYELPRRLDRGPRRELQRRQLLQPDRHVQLRRRRHGVTTEVRDERGGDPGAYEYLVFNAMASYPVHRHLTLQFNLNNIGNEKYSDRGYDRHFMPGPTRQILFSPVFSF